MVSFWNSPTPSYSPILQLLATIGVSTESSTHKCKEAVADIPQQWVRGKTYPPNIRPPKYLQQILTDVRGKADSNTIIVRDLNIPPTSMH